MKTERIIGWTQSPWHILILFLILVGPFALQYNMHYPDEMYYTDGAVLMQQDGDWLTPQLANGEARFKKPILTYWFVLAGQLLFGVSPFSSRFFFWLAGALVIGLTFLITKTLTSNKKLSTLAAIIVATHSTIVLSSSRSIPDILLCLFTTFSALGVIGLIRYGNNAPRKFIWYFYLGTALAFETKGLPALALGGIAWLYMAVNPWQRICVRKLLNIPALLVAGIIASSWFVAMYFSHGPSYLDSFFGDQVGVRVASKFARISKHLSLAIALLLGLFFPWILFLSKQLKSRFREIKHESDAMAAFQGFAILWLISIVGMSALVSTFYERYLLPVIPVMSIWLAVLLLKIDFSKKRIAYIIIYFLIGLNLIQICGATFFLIGLQGSFFDWFRLFVSTGIIGLSIYFIRTKTTFPTVIGSLLLLLIFNLAIISSQISFPGPETQAPKYLHKINFDTTNTIAFTGNNHHSAKMRVGLGPEYKIKNFHESIPGNEIDQLNYFIVDEQNISSFETEDFSMDEIASVWDHIPVVPLFEAIAKGHYESFYEQNCEKYFFVERIIKIKPEPTE